MHRNILAEADAKIGPEPIPAKNFNEDLWVCLSKDQENCTIMLLKIFP